MLDRLIEVLFVGFGPIRLICASDVRIDGCAQIDESRSIDRLAIAIIIIL